MDTSKYKAEDLHLGAAKVKPLSKVSNSHQLGVVGMFLDFIIVLMAFGVSWLIAEVIIWLLWG
jgi:hypothetical protein